MLEQQRSETPLSPKRDSRSTQESKEILRGYRALPRLQSITPLVKFVAASMEKVLAPIMKDAPGRHSNPISRGVRQVNPRNHCGELSEDLIEEIFNFVQNTKGLGLTVYLEVHGGTGIGAQNHARVLIGTPKGILVADTWKDSLQLFPIVRGNTTIEIPSDVASTGFHRYKLDLETGHIKVLTSDSTKSSDKVLLEQRVQSGYPPKKNSRRS